MFFSLSLKANDEKQLVLKSFNFKLYYTHGGQTLARQLITEAENSLETMENFLGTRMVEQIDIFLSEAPVINDNDAIPSNGSISLDNSSIYLFYSGNRKALNINLKEKLAEILINGMLYGNTIKERLKNNREINVPDWYVAGLAKYVAGGNSPNTSWMADYYEGKLKLNLNLTDKNELAEFGHAVFIYINEQYGVNKLRQILFYTKLSGKTDYAFLYVLDKSLNWVIAEWFQVEKVKYLKESNTRLPNDPELISGKLQTNIILDIKFTRDGNQLDILIQMYDGIELWNYDIATQKSVRIYKSVSINTKMVWAFVNSGEKYYLAKSNGTKSDLIIIEKTLDGKKNKPKKINLDFNYVFSIKEHPVSGLAILAQKNYNIDIFQFQLDKNTAPLNISNNSLEETDFAFDRAGNLFITVYDGKKFLLQKDETLITLYSAHKPIVGLNIYENDYLSFIQTRGDKNVGMVLNPNDSNEVYQVTNYTRSIFIYDFNKETKKVMEAFKYGNKNYIVVSQASFDKVKIRVTDSIYSIGMEPKVIMDDSIKNYSYKFVTGFEYKISKHTIPQPQTIRENKIQLKIKEYSAPKFEFKPNLIRLGYTNSQFNSPLFAYFLPIDAGIYNGSNLIAGCRVTDLKMKYSLGGNVRQPINGRGTDIDFLFTAIKEKYSFGVFMFNSVYQKEIYNQVRKYTTKEVTVFIKTKFHPKLNFKSILGYREDIMWPLSITADNLQKPVTSLRQPFIQNSIDYNFFNSSWLNYSQKLTTYFSALIFKPIDKTGFNTNLFFSARYNQSFFRIFHLSTRFSIQSSVGKQKTVWLMGGVSNWLKPQFANAAVYNTDKIGMYSTMDDFAGLPYNYQAGSSVGTAKMILSIPVNPVISQQNFNQNFFKFLTFRSYLNTGVAWFGVNPFSIQNPDNKEVIETGSMTITNYVAKNPMIWSWGTGLNSVLFGYEVGFDYAVGYNEKGRIGRFGYLTVGKEF